jgi:outer membrane protein OmpA-like peptidoglycan-associated protein
MSERALLNGSGTSAPPEEHWIPLSDLMTGLMMMFMLIAILFMARVEAESAKVKNIAVVYDEMREQLYQDLKTEFSADLPRWRAELDKDLSIRFEEPDVLFGTGDATLRPQFAAILGDFFPRYVKIISNQRYRDSIEEVRIEGHTSSVWNSQTAPDEAYFLNMELSQSRTRSVLEYVLLLPQLINSRAWLTQRLTANGLSSSRPRLNPDGTENAAASQRVEFRLRTNAETRLSDILKAAQP